MSTGVLGGGFDFSVCSVGGTWRWRVTANNVHGAGQFYQVEDIRTPFGSLANTDVPIPGEVVAAMADSLQTFRQQLQPHLSLTSQASYNITVTEGDPLTSVGTATFTNSGAFGSFMTAYGSPGASWLSVDPPSVAGLGKNASGQARIWVDPRIMLAADSPYSGHVIFQDNADPASVAPVSVMVTVLPRPEIQVQDVVALTYYMSSGVSGGPIPVAVSNSGPSGSTLGFSLSKVQNQSPWLSFTPSSGSNIASGSDVTVTFSVVTANVPHIPGVYTEIVRVSSPNASNSPRDVEVRLTVVQ